MEPDVPLVVAEVNGAAGLCVLGLLIVGHQSCDGLAVARDRDGLAALDRVEQLGELGFGHRGLNLLHFILTGQINWLNR
jgi:hypothetical protein